MVFSSLSLHLLVFIRLDTTEQKSVTVTNTYMRKKYSHHLHNEHGYWKFSLEDFL